MGMVFQSYAVWPHMTLFENVAYPLRARGMPRGDISKKVMNALKLVQLDGLEHRYSTQISGGQQQRVALARSLVSEPSLLLFDEPLSNLDANLRVQMRLEIRELQERLNFTAVYVTHDQTEAMALSDRIAIMDHGVMQQIADPREIYNKPQNRFVASFMGTTNLFEGAKKAGAGGEPLVLSDEGIDISIGDQHMPDGAEGIRLDSSRGAPAVRVSRWERFTESMEWQGDSFYFPGGVDHIFGGSFRKGARDTCGTNAGVRNGSGSGRLRGAGAMRCR